MAVSPGHPASLLYPLRHHSPIAVTNSFFCIHSLKHTVTRYQSINHSTMLTITIFLTDSVSLTHSLSHYPTLSPTILLTHTLIHSISDTHIFLTLSLNHNIYVICGSHYHTLRLNHYFSITQYLTHSPTHSSTHSLIQSISDTHYLTHYFTLPLSRIRQGISETTRVNKIVVEWQHKPWS